VSHPFQSKCPHHTNAPAFVFAAATEVIPLSGLSGPRGEQGKRGLSARPAPKIKRWLIDKKRYVCTPLMSDRSLGPSIELHDLFQQFLNDAGRS
jgi:hypothetical protein